MRIVMIGCALLAVAACQKPAESNGNEQAPAATPGPVKGADRSHNGSPFPAAAFNDPDGTETSLKAFTGKPTLVNLWATWCAPCVKELPTLDRLAQAQEGRLNVVAVSQDMGPQPSVEAFLKSHNIAALEAYHDPKMALSGALGPDTVLPTSILYDANGKEVWRYVGDLDWTGADAAKLLGEAGATKAR
jgi:thiol-disulfide isomerase/thioredoxin